MNTTTQQDTQAAANKAAEEGGLPELPDALEIDWPEMHSQALGCGVEDRSIHDRYEAAEYGWQDGVDKAIERVPSEIYDADQMREYALLAIAADRASRQVANKAEVEPVVLQLARQALEAVQRSYGIQLLSYPPQDAWMVNGVDEKVRAALKAIATPPATTGASTVLTDERIEAIWSREAGQAEAGKRRIAFARAIACEVAAQAGQVASVPSAVAVPEELDVALTVFDMGLGFALCHRDFGSIRAAVKKLQEDFTAIRKMIAPSPAKESKPDGQFGMGYVGV